MTPELIDGFEDGDIAEYSGDTDEYAATTTNPFDGDYSLECTTTSAGSKRIVRTDVEWGPDDDSELHGWISREHSAGIRFGALSRDENYSARLRDSGETDVILELRVSDGGSDSLELTVLGIDRTEHEWLRVGVDWKPDGTLIATAYDESATSIDSISAVDTTYDAGGVGVGAYTGDTVEITSYFDTIQTVDYGSGEFGSRDALSGEFDTHTSLTGTFDVRTSLEGEL